MTKEKLLFNAIKNNDLIQIKELLQNGVNPDFISDSELYSPLEYSIMQLYGDYLSMDIVLTLLEYESNPNIGGGNGYPLDDAIRVPFPIDDILLRYGANPNYICDDSMFISAYDDITITKRLLDYGAQYNMGIPTNRIVTNALHNAVRQGNLEITKLLLNYGADPLSDDDSYMFNINQSCKEWLFDDVELSNEECKELKDLLNPSNPPYLKLGEREEDKYIIYENKIIEEVGYLPYAVPFLLADKQKQKDKKYLYLDNKIDAFVYWCYTNNLLSESVIPGVKLYEEKLGQINYKNINSFITNIIGDKVTTDIFNEEGKAFATSYLTVTHWWYNLHTDFNRLYQDENVKLPRAIQSQEEFDTLMKLLDIRHEQFKSGKDFNSNQNKAELEALIEGKELPKRVVDLSFLEEDNTKTPKEKANNDTDIIPDDFFKNN